MAGGVFRHADEQGEGGVLRKGWVQHTTVGTGMWHSEINESAEEPMRFVQMWFIPAMRGLAPAVQQRPVEQAEREGRFLPLVSDDPNAHPGALPIVSAAAVYSSFLPSGAEASAPLRSGYNGYLYVLEGGPVTVVGEQGRIEAPALAAVELRGERVARVVASADAELLLVEAGKIA